MDEGASYQQELWQSALQQKLARMKARLPSENAKLAGSLSAAGFLQTLTASYTESGSAKKIQKVREVFTDVEPFVLTINTIARSNTIAGLVWGMLTVVFQVSAMTRAKISKRKEARIALSDLILE